MARTPFGRLKLTKDGKKYSVLTVWKSDMGGYSISPDKHSEQYPAMGLFDALKAWGQGAYLDYWLADDGARNAPRGGAQTRQRVDGPVRRESRETWESVGEHPPDDFDEIPF